MRLIRVLIAVVLSAPCMAALNIEGLKTEFVTDPLGVDVPRPRVSWILVSQERGQIQTAFRVLVASSRDRLAGDQGDLWDSGIVKSDQTLGVEYAGKGLTSAQQVFWKVRTWDGANQPSDWSPVGTWTMGILGVADWSPAKWIAAPADLNAPTLVLRRQFDVKAGLKRAVVFVSGMGQYEMSLNGRKVGNDLLAPGWTKYDRTCLYDTFDITPMLTSGANATGLLLGNGMYNVVGGRYTKFKGTFGPQKAIALIRLEYADGSVEQIGTDEKWKVSAGPITFSCVYGGEDWDARLEQPGSNSARFDDSTWKTAIPCSGPGGALRGVSCAAPPIREIESFKPKKLTDLQSGSSIWDMGQNASMMVRLVVKGPAGSIIRITPSELLGANGRLDPSSTRNGLAYWQYTLKGAPSESWMSRFFYHGMRYVQVDLIPAADGGELPVLDSLEGVVVHSSSAPIGEFACSNELFNRIRTLIRWAQRSNEMSVLTDCPHRERLGWLEQIYLNGPSLRYEFDLNQFFVKAMNDMSDSQQPDGLVPDIAPEYTVFQDGFRDSPEWGSAFVLAAWQQYEWTGDASLFARYYEGMKRYVGYLKSKSSNGLVDHGLGDWFDLGPARPGRAQLTPIMLTATATYYTDLKVLERTALLLGKSSDAADFAAQAEAVRESYNAKFFNSETGQYSTRSQTANAMSVALGLCNPQNAPKVIEAIVSDIHQRGNALTSGDVGYTYLLRALADGGRSDVIFEMNNQSGKPGYGYQLAKGATALTESWDARGGGNGSQNHFMLGHIMEWFYRDLAGIGGDPTGPGFKKIIIKPTPVGDITWARASLKSVRGLIASDWKRDGGTFTLNVTIPPNTTATVYVPTTATDSVQESGRPASQSAGVTFLRSEGNAAVFQVKSGAHAFTAKNEARPEK